MPKWPGLRIYCSYTLVDTDDIQVITRDIKPGTPNCKPMGTSEPVPLGFVYEMLHVLGRVKDFPRST